MTDYRTITKRAASQHGVLSADQLLASGFTKRMIQTRVHNGEWIRRHRGVLQVAGTSASWEQSLIAAVLAAGNQAAASHRAAARLWELRSLDDDVEVSIRYPRKLELEQVTVHRSRDLELQDITEVGGIPVTTPERTICDLGLIFPEHEVDRMLRHSIATGLVTSRDLWTMRLRTSKQGRNGTGVLERRLLELPEMAEYTESGLEILFLELCRRSGASAPSLQVPVSVGGRRLRVDFAWPHKRVFVEVDGAQFHSSPQQLLEDSRRQNLLVAAGWTPIRFRFEDLRDQPVQCIRMLRTTLDL